jgi:RNA polymerase sigma-70 factor (ECF subfamily)
MDQDSVVINHEVAMSPTGTSLDPRRPGGPVAPTLRDRQLMAEVRGGGVAAFEQLYDRYHHRAYRVALAVCRDEGRAQDAVQDAFLSIWAGPAAYRADRGPVAPWLLTVVRYRAIDVARRHGPNPARRAGACRVDGQVTAGDVDQATIDRDDAARLRASLSLLPETQQEVITLAFYGELSHREIATHLGVPHGTIKGRMRLGLKKLRADIEAPVP